MSGPRAQRINGHVFSWSSISITLRHALYYGVRSIDYRDSLKRGELRGAGSSAVIWRTRGEHSASCEIEMLLEDWAAFRADLGDSFGEVVFDVSVSHSEREDGGPGRVTTDTINGLTIDDVAQSPSQGSDPSTVKLTCSTKDPVLHGAEGLRLFEETNSEAGFFGGAEGPLYAPSPMDTVVLKLGGKDYKLPGLCRVKGGAQIEVDKAKAKGTSGTRLRVCGYLPGPVEIECVICTKRQWERLREIVKALWKKPTKKAEENVLDIYHPALDIVGISSVLFIGIGAPAPGPIPRSLSVVLHMHEQIPHKEHGVKKPKPATVEQVREHEFEAEAENEARTRPGDDADYLSPEG